MKRWVLLFLALAVAYGFRLGTRTLWEPDEGRYAEIAREMRASGDWLTPRYNQGVYLEKPPLLYWATAGSFSLMGREDGWSARLPLVLCTLLCCGLVAWTARRRLGDEAAFWAAAAYGSCLYVFALSHVLLTDGFLTLGVTGVFAALELESPLLLGISLGIGILAKGPVAVVLPCLGLGAECLLARSLEPVRRIRGIVPATLIACVVALPWFVMEARAVPGFLNFFIIHEHFQRFATNEAHRKGPLLLFIGIAIVGWCPWWGGLWEGVRNGRKEPALRRALAWAGAIILFFTVSKSKLPPYVWPAFPPLALVAGWGMARSGCGKRRLVLLGGFLILLMGVTWVAERMDAVKSARDLSARILADDPQGEGIIVNHRGFRPSLPFYTRRHIALWGNPDELTFGMHRMSGSEQETWFFRTKAEVGEDQGALQARSLARMQTLWASPRKVYLVVRATDARDPAAVPLKPQGRVLCEIGEDAVLVNR